MPAEPRPDSLEKMPRATPQRMAWATVAPRKPPAADVPVQVDRPDGSEHTLEEVGRSFNVTRERIRQIEAKALRKLRHPSRAAQLRPFLDSGAT